MRITEIEIHPILPPCQDFNATTLSRYHAQSDQARTIFVVKTDDGLEGYGEMWGGPPDGDALREKFIGTSPFDWINDNTSLAMNMATYDLMGKYLGQPVWKLLGPKVRSWIPVAAWTVSQPPGGMAEEVCQAAQKGYHWIKYHMDEVQNVVDQTEAMQKVAPPGFKVHYDFNANSNYYTMRPILAALECFSVAGRFEDVLSASDEDGYRILREQCKLPVIIHHGPPEFMLKRLVDGYMAGHAPIGMGLKVGAVAEMTNTPIMYQQCGGTINQTFLAHEVAVIKMATIDHVSLCHLWKEDVTVETMPVVGGSVAVPEGPGLGVELDRDKLEKFKAMRPCEPARSLVRMRYAEGLTIYLRHEPNKPGSTDNMRFQERLHRYEVPGYVPSYANPIATDFWEGQDDSAAFERLWEQTVGGPVWVENREVPES